MKLPKVLDLSAAIILHEAILRDVQAAGGARLDASDVEILTLPCTQILVAAKRDAKIWIDQPSEAFVATFADLGLDWADGMSELPAPADAPAVQPLADIAAGNPVADMVAEVASAFSTEMPPQPIMDVAPSSDQGNTIAADLIEESASAVNNIRILTIDDSKTMRDMLMLTLVDAGFDVIQAVDGKDGIDLLERENVDVVITDINMPRMDGYEVVRQLRLRPEHKTTPILVLTTESEAEKKNIAREAGATGWLVKPFDPERLIATVRKVAC
jgi:two-component system, chemotaxis family, chemotaxis protein CheY